MRLRHLDLIRGIAVVLVLGRHMDPVPPGGSPMLVALADSWRRIGWTGVDLFFVLSGFLVSSLLFSEYLQHGSIRPGRFLCRRGMKIYPAFWAFLAGTLVLRFLGVPVSSPITLPKTAAELLFVQNYLPGLNVHTWSLAVEEHFYLSLPFILLAVRGIGLARGQRDDPFRGILPLVALVAVVCLLLRLQISEALPYRHRTHLFPTHLRIDSLFCGVAVAYLHCFHRGRVEVVVRAHARELRLTCIMFLLPVLLLPLEDRFVHTWGFTSLSLSFAILLMLALHAPSPRLARFGPLSALAAVGVHSYSIYLWHIPAKYVTAQLLAGSNAGNHGPRTLAYLLSSIVFGMMMSRLVETHALRVRDRLFPSRSAPIGLRGAEFAATTSRPSPARSPMRANRPFPASPASREVRA
jgi:peptidoglycan/LPS O-acetylase OafA/YrhL